MFRYLSTIAVLLCLGSTSFSQDLKINAGFSKDSLKIGEEINYTLSISYPRDLDIVFPDSTFSFAPFEFLGKNAFPTRTDSLTSFDSAVYSLATFEIDSIQKLQLPIFVVTSGDSLELLADLDSIVLAHVVTQIPDSVAMKDNTLYSTVRLAFNYPYLVVGVTSFILISIILFLVFGKSVRRKIRLYRLRKLHEKFLTSFTRTISNIKSDSEYNLFEELMIDWKKYMEKLNSVPYTKLTSKEIEIVNPDKELIHSLQAIDKAIYGNLGSSEISQNFDYLRRMSEDSYHEKVTEIKNG